MKVKVANEIRNENISRLIELFANEDIGLIASNAFNFPIEKDGEEGWVEIVVKVPKYSDNEGYELREDYITKCNEKVERERKAKEKKEKDIAEKKAKSKAKE